MATDVVYETHHVAASPGSVTVDPPGGVASPAIPAGSDTQLQFNDGGSLAGAATLIWNKATSILSGVAAHFNYLTLSNGANEMAINYYHAGIAMGSAGSVTWGSGDATGPDVGMERSAAGRVKVNDGSTGLGTLLFKLPSTDPHIVGALWNNAGTITVSAG